MKTCKYYNCVKKNSTKVNNYIFPNISIVILISYVDAYKLILVLYYSCTKRIKFANSAIVQRYWLGVSLDLGRARQSDGLVLLVVFRASERSEVVAVVVILFTGNSALMT